MPYLSSDRYDYDIFVSYAHVDDEKWPDDSQGWVTYLITCVKSRLTKLLGGSDAYSLWMDYELRASQPITPEILEKVRRSRMLLAIFSPNYLRSEWCQRELATFAALLGSDPTRRVFIVEREPVDRAELPPSLADLKRAKFWVTDQQTGNPRTFSDPIIKGDADFFGAVDKLARDIKAELTLLKRPGQIAARPAPAGSVFLAEVTDDLDEQRNNVGRYLDQAGVTALPSASFPLEPGAFRDAVNKGLAEADLFVQLLSGVAGKRPPDLPEGRAQCQLELARSRGKPILQWRSPELDPATVSDERQRALLEAAEVRAEGIEDFKRAICRRLAELRRPPPTSRLTAENPCVLVDTESTDRPLASQLCDILNKYNADAMQPTDDPDPAKLRADLVEKLSDCHALMLVYGATTRDWVDQRLRQLRKMVIDARGPLRGLAIVEGPPDPKEERLVRPAQWKVLDCRHGLDESEIRRFLDGLQEGPR